MLARRFAHLFIWALLICPVFAQAAVYQYTAAGKVLGRTAISQARQGAISKAWVIGVSPGPAQGK